MQKQEFIDAIRNIGTCEDDVQRRTLLANLQTEAGKDYDTIATLTEQNQNLTSDNETLRSANMKLFLQVGEQKTPEEINKNKSGVGGTEPKKREWTDLFDEKGGIK